MRDHVASMTLHYTDLNQDLSLPRVGVALSNPKQSLYRNVFKRVFDTLVVLACMPIVAPIVVLMAAIVAFDGKNPFYSQLRVGLNGRHFRLWKIRTMTVDADDVLETYLQTNEKARAEWDCHQKLKHDPRITPIGRFLRKTSMDELPQLFNVVQGSMSLVGPRPMMLEQEKFYDGAAYYHLRPGVTGFWQISDRNESSFVARVQFDEAYNRQLSFMTDICLTSAPMGQI